MVRSRRARILLLLLCLTLGAGGGAVAAEWFAEWLDIPNGDPRELIAAGLFYCGFGGGLGSYFVCIAAARRISGLAGPHGPEADYDDNRRPAR